MYKQLTFEDKYAVIGRKDTRYEGVFVTAVKTTGIFCRPSCRARKPKAENVVFYASAREALQHGYRPCKVCKPMEKLDATPAYITQLIDELHRAPCVRIRDSDLRLSGLEPSHIRRWFKQHHGITFQAYQRMLRLNTAFSQIHNGKTITHAAFDSGYQSLSGFNTGYRAIFGASPKQAKTQSVLNIIRLTTPIGPMYACASRDGVCLVDFTDRRMLETAFKDLCKRLDAVILPGMNSHLRQLQSELEEYFAGQRKQFTVPIHMPGTPFQRAAWKRLLDIPYGETRTYKQQAYALGKPKAIRAVAAANGQNRISILIPCHRVIGSSGDLVGYGGGVHRKKWLLEFESAHSL